MAIAVGIDLGTTNSAVAVVEDGQPWVIPDDNDELLLPSCVGVNTANKIVVGQSALRQYAAAPDRTVKSIKRLMGTSQSTRLGDRDYLPQEISAAILRSLKQRAEAVLETEVQQAVITVPAYFTDAQRQATKEAGEIAGLDVLQIINEPTAAALTYELRTEETELVLVYDLGGGTFDVSVVEIAGDVTEVLASHGNNRLGGDDFDRRLQLLLAERFQQEHGVSVPDDLVTQARLLKAAERVKIELSERAFVTVRESYLGSKGKAALHLETEVSREEFETAIEPLLKETLDAIDRALKDAELKSEDLDRLILVGGSTRIPLVQNLVAAHLGQAPLDNVQPDLCVALGAALQAAVLVGEEVDAVLVDVTPHSLGIAAAVSTPMGILPGMFSAIIERNSVIPVSRSEVYSTVSDNQEAVVIEVFQGENPIANENVPLGSFKIEGLPPRPAGDIQVEVHFDFDLNGILTVTATEKGKGQQGELVVNDAAAVSRMSSHDVQRARDAIEARFEQVDENAAAAALLDRAYDTLGEMEPQAAEELNAAIEGLEQALDEEDKEALESRLLQLEELLESGDE